MIIDKGTIVYDGDIQYIKENFSSKRQIDVIMGDQESASLLEKNIQNEKGLSISTEANRLRVSYNQHDTDTGELLRLLLSKGNPQDISMTNEDIESLIGQIYRHGIDNIKKRN